MIECSPCSNATRMLKRVLAGLDRVTDPEFLTHLTRAISTMRDTTDPASLPDVREAMDGIAGELGDLRDEINALDIDTLTPVEALLKLNEIKRLVSPKAKLRKA